MKTESISVDGFTISVGVLQSDTQIPTIILEIRANPPEQKQADVLLSPCFDCMYRTPFQNLPPPTPEEAKKIPNIISHNPPRERGILTKDNGEPIFFVPVHSGLAHML